MRLCVLVSQYIAHYFSWVLQREQKRFGHHIAEMTATFGVRCIHSKTNI